MDFVLEAGPVDVCLARFQKIHKNISELKRERDGSSDQRNSVHEVSVNLKQ